MLLVILSTLMQLLLANYAVAEMFPRYYPEFKYMFIEDEGIKALRKPEHIVTVDRCLEKNLEKEFRGTLTDGDINLCDNLKASVERYCKKNAEPADYSSCVLINNKEAAFVLDGSPAIIKGNYKYIYNKINYRLIEKIHY